MLLNAITAAGVSLPHLMTGEIGGSLPALVLGLVLGLGCLRVALLARTRGGRALGAIGIAIAGLAPLIAFLGQEAAEREPGLETAHAEPTLLAAVLIQAPLLILAILAVRLLVAAVRTVVRALGRRPTPPPRRREVFVAPAPASPLSMSSLLVSSNGQRAPPFNVGTRLMAPLG